MKQPGEKARGSGREPSRDWRANAACRTLADRYFDPWDSDDKAAQPNATAAQICGSCPVRRACLIEAIANKEPYGTWGGLTLRQRKALIRAQRRLRCPICKGSLLVFADTDAQACMSCGITWRTRKIMHDTERYTTPGYQSTSPYSPATDTRTS